MRFRPACPLLLLFFAGLLCLTRIQAAVVPGHVEGWGDNSFGQATPPPGLNDIIAVATGFTHSLALRANGTVVAWGNNSQGQLNVPPGLSNVIAIAARAHSVALKADGTVVAWGNYGNLVTNPPPNLNDVIAISAGASANGNVFTLALRRNGTIAAWGNSPGDLGVPPGLSNVVQISAGYVHSFARKSDGTFVGWGFEQFGTLTPPPGVSNVIDIAAGQSTSLAVLPNGTVVKWGGTFDSNDVPAGVTGVIDVEPGNQHVLALRTNGTVLAWGAPFAGFLPEGINGVTAIAVGGNHNLVLTARPVIVSISPPAQAEIGSSVTLTVSAFGEPLSYQWQRFGTNLPGKTNAALVMNAIEVADAGPYKVIVKNPHGTNAGSTAISLPPPTITTQPQNSTVYRGEIARFNVTANGLAPLAYQWFKDTNAIAGATNSVLEIATMDRNDSGPYHAVVRDAAGGSVTSAVANLIVIDPRENTLVFRPVLDTSIHSSGTNPLGTTILAGTRRNGIVDRGLLRFDLTSIGTNVAVQSAFLRLSVVKSPTLAADSTFQLHRVLVPWTAEATWTSASPQVPWSAAGGVAGVDYSVPGIPGEFLFGSGDYVFDSSDQMLGDINLWIQSPATNHGWMLISDSENVGGTARHFSSSESANPPELVIRSFIPAPPPTITNASVQSTNFVFQFQGSPGWIYSIQTSADVNGEVWAPFTNAPAGAALTPIVISVPITNRHQFFRAFRY